MSSCSTNCRPRQTHDCFATKPHRNRSPSDTADLRAHTWIDDDDPFWRNPRGTLPVSTSHLAFHTVTEEREASTGGKLFRRCRQECGGNWRSAGSENLNIACQAARSI